MHPFYLEKLYRSRYEDWLRQAEGERLVRVASVHQPRRAWALSLGRSIVRLGQRVERFGLSGHGSHRHLLYSSK
ncbi:MAG TPA: hypothetical protein VF026_03445 [Ktedonobacteraceae bacterium]